VAFLVERLEKCLRAWEDYWFLTSVANTALRATGKPLVCPNEKAVVNAPTFRKKLLNIQRQPIVYSDFLDPMKAHDGFLTRLPFSLGGWCQHSRRVYYLTEEIQAILNATSLKGVTWSDISFPFPVYALSLQRPVIDPEGDRFDFIMVTNYHVQDNNGRVLPGLELRFFCQQCDQYDSLTEANRQNIRNCIRNGDWEHVIKLVQRYLRKVDCIIGAHITFDDQRLEEEVMVTAERCYEGCDADIQAKMNRELAISLWDTMVRIVVGMCLYLKTLPSGSPHQSEWRPAPRSGLTDPRAISNEAQLCTVSSCYTLTRPERVALELEGTAEERKHYELSCHFRQGHWRRPPGYGHIPAAPKTVHVRPCLVRKDRLQEGELPGGAESIVS